MLFVREQKKTKNTWTYCYHVTYFVFHAKKKKKKKKKLLRDDYAY